MTAPTRCGAQTTLEGTQRAIFAHLRSATPSVKLVAAADKLDNLRAIIVDYRVLGSALWDRFNAGYEDQLWYYRRYLKALENGPPSLMKELEMAIGALERLPPGVAKITVRL